MEIFRHVNPRGASQVLGSPEASSLFKVVPKEQSLSILSGNSWVKNTSEGLCEYGTADMGDKEMSCSLNSSGS